MRSVEVLRNGFASGILTEESSNSYSFRYHDEYYKDSQKPAISLTLSKTQQEYRSEYLFPFFYNLLSEGVNRKLQCRQLKIDEDDHFGLLMATAQYDTVGAVTVRKI